MNVVAPNLAALIGDSVAARLISKVRVSIQYVVLPFVVRIDDSVTIVTHKILFFLSVFQKAGSLTNLAKAPASTVQILGAEKALFRALKTKGNTPKYGLIYHSTFIGRADAKNKGRISRYLANKCSIATRIDSFSDEVPNSLYGEKLRDQVEERLKFYETGAAPRRNIDVMEEVSKQLKAAAGNNDGGGGGKKTANAAAAADEDAEMQVVKSNKKKKKKDKKRKSMEGTDKNDDEKKAAKKAKKEAKKEKKRKKSF
jgi:nucleolar protein 56